MQRLLAPLPRLGALLRQHWVVAAGCAITVLVSLGLCAACAQTIFALYLCCTLVGGYFGGMRGGLLSTAIGALLLAVQYALFPPEPPKLHPIDLALSVLSFILVGSLASYLSDQCLQALRHAERLQQALHRAETAQAAHSHEQIAALEGAVQSLREQLTVRSGEHARALAAAQQAETALAESHQQHVQHRAAWQQTEEQLRSAASAAREETRQLQAQLAEAQRLREAHGRDHGQALAEARKTEEKLRRELTAREEARREQEERAQQELQAARDRAAAEQRQAIDELRQRHQSERRRAEEKLRRELVEREEALREKERHVQQMQELQAVRDREAAEQHQALQDLSSRYETARNLVADLGEAVCVVDGEGQITFANAAAGRLLGWPEEELLGRSFAEWVGEGVLCRQAAGEVVVKDEVTLRRRDGLPFLGACSIVGRPEGSVISLRDVSEWRRREQELRRRESADGLWRRLARRVRPGLERASHAAAQARAETIDAELRQVVSAFDTLALVERLAREELQVGDEPVELETVVQRAVAAVRRAVEQRGQHLTVYLPLQPAWLRGEAILLAEALAGLLDNAARYSAPGAQVRLSVEQVADELTFHVRDEGPGLSPEVTAALPQLSARSGHFWQDGEGGLGLGLALARDAAQLHGGQLSAVAAEGQGCAFVLRLPALVTADLPLAG
jgi:PAS domain S-box-containing protein